MARAAPEIVEVSASLHRHQSQAIISPNKPHGSISRNDDLQSFSVLDPLFLGDPVRQEVIMTRVQSRRGSANADLGLDPGEKVLAQSASKLGD